MGRNRGFQAFCPALALAEYRKRTAEVVLRRGPLERKLLPRPFLERLAEGRNRGFQVFCPTLSRAECRERNAKADLRRGPVERKLLPRRHLERRAVGRDGSVERIRVAALLSNRTLCRSEEHTSELQSL